MQQKKMIVRVAPLLVALLAVGRGAGAQTRYRLQNIYHPGDRFSVDESMDLNLALKEKVDGQDDPPANLVQREHNRYTEQVLATQKSDLAAIRRTYSLSRRVVTRPDLLQTTAATSLQGKTVSVRKRGNQVVLAAARGKLASADRQDLLHALDPENDFFPDHDVAVGEEWSVDPKRLLSHFPGLDQGQIKCQLAEVRPFAGHPCARIHFTAQMSGQLAGLPGPTTLNLTGDLYDALDLHQILSQEASGPMKVQGQLSANGRVISFSGEGTMRLKDTRQWLTGARRAS